MSIVRSYWRFVVAGLICLLSSTTLQAQTLADLRAQLNQRLADTHFAKSYVGQINDSNAFQVTGAR